MSERPLVAFTVLAQTAVGTLLTLVALETWSGALSGDPAARVLVLGVLLAVVLVMVSALAVSLLHLGSPSTAWRAIANLRSSWLSREVLAAILFSACGAAFAALRASGRGPDRLRITLATATALSGVVLVYAMARVYRIRTVPAWNTPLTTASFFATTALLGTLPVGVALVLLPGVPAERISLPLRFIALAAAAVFGARLLARRRGALRGIRRILPLLGLALSLAMLVGAGRPPALPIAAFAVAVATETLGRYLFYSDGLRKPL